MNNLSIMIHDNDSTMINGMDDYIVIIPLNGNFKNLKLR